VNDGAIPATIASQLPALICANAFRTCRATIRW